MSDNVIAVTDADFEKQVLQGELPVMVDMWAPWCGPCRLVSPLLEELARENAGKIRVCKLNIDENRVSAERFGISAIPTIILFSGGEELDRLVGVQSKDRYQKAIDAALGA